MSRTSRPASSTPTRRGSDVTSHRHPTLALLPLTLAVAIATVLATGASVCARRADAGAGERSSVAEGPAYAAPDPGTARVAGEEPPAFKVRITNNNLVGLTTTNYGFFGNNFTSRSPSFEFPL